MTWNILDGSLRLTEFTAITKLRLLAVNQELGVSTELNPKGISVINKILSFVIDEVSIKLTQSNFNLWKLRVEIQVNYKPEWIPLAETEVTVGVNSMELSYFGSNILYIDLANLDWSGISCIQSEGSNPAQHLINVRDMHLGVSKSRILEYVGNEKLVNLNMQIF